MCTDISNRVSFNRNGTLDPALFDYMYDCAHPSAVGWAILIQYLLLVKLFLTTLLTAMFAHTKAKVDAQSDQIWMFQRYEIVVDYEQRLRLPPPLTIISYGLMLVQWICKQSVPKTAYKRVFNFKKSQQVDGKIRVARLSSGGTQPMQLSKKQIDHSNYWKIVVQDFAKKIEDSAREKDYHKEQSIG